MLVHRRKFLKFGLGTAAGTMVFGSLSPKALAQACTGVATPRQTSGPFYPGESQFQLESDLTVVSGSSTRAKGQVIYIKGKVVDEQCRPITNATVEIWQACESGKYNNPNDPNPAPLDPNFKYWGEAYTNSNGEYMFKTIRPGAYPADTDWVRPPHIHFKISALGYRELITQMYFKNDPLNDKDLILQQTPMPEREQLVVDFQPSPAEFEPNTITGTFDITLRSVRSRP